MDGRKTTVRAALQDTYSAIEEAKADISGLFALQYLVDKGVLDKALERTMYTTFLASCFRSIRFGLNEAHGKGIALQLNTLLDAGAFKVAPDGTFSVDAGKVKEAVRGADRRADDPAGGRRSGQGGGAAGEARRDATRGEEGAGPADRVPVDIEPRFVTAEKLAAGK